MFRQRADRIPPSGLETGSYEMIHLGSQAALMVPAPRWVLAGLDFRFDAQFRADTYAARSQGLREVPQ